MGKKRPIIQFPAPVLRARAKEVPVKAISGKKIQTLLADMKATLAVTPDGVGLAAPQIGESLRVFIISEEAEEIDRAENASYERRKKEKPDEVSEKPYENREWKYYVFINPVAKNHSRRMRDDPPEGCLSVRGRYGTVKRYEKVSVEAYNEHGKKRTWGKSRFFARVLQHELDHLEGTLFIDKARGVVEVPKKKEL